MPDPLPAFVAPMLARLGEPFDSDEHLFELKWDGIRALTFAEGGAHRLVTRRRNDVTARYPELAFLAGLPDGTILDGELVVMREGRPDFPSVLKREQARGEHRIRALTRTHPACYVAFDVLYRDGRPLLDLPLTERRAHLAELCRAAGDLRLIASDGIEGAGLAFFEEARRRGLEGVVAKRLRSPYQPGRRTGEWTKFKLRQELPCVVLGYVPDGDDDFRSLVIAAERDGHLAPVGRVGSGLTTAARRDLWPRMRPLRRATPIVPCEDREARWLDPGLLCLVSYLELTPAGNLRAPVFERALQPPET